MKNRKGNQTKNAWKVGESRDHIFRDRKTRNLKRKGEGKLQGIPYFFSKPLCKVF